ncbi:MAG TPA: helix-turn-helix transcriptional regulator [Candidatus Doudnabacteria bacterium]|nr:helix-turn-helix transcriptional regulator [Candidatus Doudnabacteria bacterium]
MKKRETNILKGAVVFDEMLAKEMKNKKFAKAYQNLEFEYQIRKLLLLRRIQQNLTQRQLAKKIGIKQPIISRLESGNYNPSVKFLKKVAKALDAKLEISLKY